MDGLPDLCIDLIRDALLGSLVDEAQLARTGAALAAVGNPVCTRLSRDVYEALDPGCLAAIDKRRNYEVQMRDRIAKCLAADDRPKPQSTHMNEHNKAAELSFMCKRMNLPSSGTKAAMVSRLRHADEQRLKQWQQLREVRVEIMMRPTTSALACPVRSRVRRLVRAVRKGDMNITHQGAKDRFGLRDQHLATLPSELRVVDRFMDSSGRRVRLYDYAAVQRMAIKLYGVDVAMPQDEQQIIRQRLLKRKREHVDRQQADRLATLLTKWNISREEASDVSPRAAGAISAYISGKSVPTLDEDVKHAASCIHRRNALLRALANAGCTRVIRRNTLSEAFVRGDTQQSAYEVAMALLQ